MKSSLIDIATDIGCKNACKYCPQDVTAKNYGENERTMSMDVFKKCFDKMPKEIGLVFSPFSEPWQNKNTTDMIEYAYKNGHGIYIVTTLAGMTPEDIKRLKCIRFKGFSVHLQSKTEHFVESETYLSLLDELCLSVSNLTFVFFGELDDNVKDILKKYGHSPTKLKVRSRAGVLFNPGHKTGRIFCGAEGAHVLLPNGDVVLCCEDFGLKHKLGNLLTGTFDDLHSGKPWKDLKKQFKEYDNDIICRDCETSTIYFSKKHLQRILERTKIMVFVKKIRGK